MLVVGEEVRGKGEEAWHFTSYDNTKFLTGKWRIG